MFQHLFHIHKTPQPRFAQSLFLALVAIFVFILPYRPEVGLTGLGTTLIVAAALVILNRDRIWTDYSKAYKKRKGGSIFTAPNQIFYTINVVFLWPFIAFLGVMCLYAAYYYQG